MTYVPDDNAEKKSTLKLVFYFNIRKSSYHVSVELHGHRLSIETDITAFLK